MLKTLAMRITRQNYPIAAACLNAGFITVPFHEVDGAYLVINEVSAMGISDQGDRPYMMVENTWLKEEAFLNIYYSDETLGDIGTFFHVMRK